MTITDIFSINSKNFKKNKYYILFNNSLFQLYKPDNFCDIVKNTHEYLPGIFIKNKFCFLAFFKMIITIKNKRDKIVLFSTNNINKEINILYYEKGTRDYELLSITKNQFYEKKFSLDSIRYPTNEIGGNGDRCALKAYMKSIHLYPRTSSDYYFLDYEDIFNLPSELPELKKICKDFCIDRNSEHTDTRFNIIIAEDKENTANNLINSLPDKVYLSINKNNVLSVINGNHRICFLKRFKDDFKINIVNPQNIQGDYQYCSVKLEKELKEILNKYNEFNSSKQNSYDIMESFVNESKRIGFDSETAHIILSKGYYARDIFNLKKSLLIGRNEDFFANDNIK